jgi:hypothetical protein
MTFARRLNSLSAALVLLFTQCATAQDKSSCDACSVVSQALLAAHRLDPGMTRADVEADFAIDGGLQTAGTARYIFKKCPVIQILVRFEGERPGAPAASLPTDRIVTV